MTTIDRFVLAFDAVIVALLDGVLSAIDAAGKLAAKLCERCGARGS